MHRIVLSCVSPELDTHPSGDLFWLLWSGANDYCNIHTQSDRLNPCIWKLSKSRQWAKGLWRDGLGPRWRKYSPTLNSNYNDNATTLRLPCFNRKPLLLILLLLLLAAPLVSHFKALKRFAPTPLLVSSSKRQILCEYWKEEEKGPMEYDHSWQFQCSTVKRRRTKNNQMIETTK